MKGNVLVDQANPLSGQLAYSWINKPTSRNKRPTVLLLNGSLFNTHQWDIPLTFGLRPAFMKRAAFLSYDYLGMGKSSLVPTTWDMETIARQAWHLLDSLDIETIHLFGVSKGTIVAQYMAALAPKRVHSLAGYGWFHYDYSDMDAVVRFFSRRLSDFADLEDRPVAPLTWEDFCEIWNRAQRYMAAYGPTKVPGFLSEIALSLVRRKIYQLLAPTPLRTMYDWFAYAIRMMPQAGSSFREHYPTLQTIPTLIQHATKDGTLPFRMAEELHRALPQSKLIAYGHGYNHVSIMIRPKHAWSVARDFRKFFNQLP